MPFPRAILPVLLDRLRTRRVTVLTGSRQAGKTTLVRDLLPAAGVRNTDYITLDDPEGRLRLASEPVRLIDRPGRVVVLDEVQKLPVLLDAVKLLSDRDVSTRFLLLGSSQIVLLSRVRETLAGRSTLLDLWPLAVSERVEAQHAPTPTIDLVWADGEGAMTALAADPPEADEMRRLRGAAEEVVLWGGFPALDEIDGDAARRTWLSDFRRTYLERDLSDLGRVADLDQFALAQNFIAARTATIFSLSEVSRELGVAVNTVKRYLRFLEISYQVHLLRPWLPRTEKRLVKNPKVYWTDVGLARYLANRWDPSDGAIYETFVLGEILKWRSARPDVPEPAYYRTHAGREVDFVIADAGRLLAIEAKASARVHPADAMAVSEFLAEYRPRGGKGRWALGLVVYRGRDVVSLADGVWGVPDWILFGGLESSLTHPS